MRKKEVEQHPKDTTQLTDVKEFAVYFPEPVKKKKKKINKKNSCRSLK